MSDDRGTSGSGILIAFLAGAFAGAAVALLTTTKTGREMRTSVKDWAKGSGGREVVERAARSLRNVFDAAADR